MEFEEWDQHLLEKERLRKKAEGLQDRVGQLEAANRHLQREQEADEFQTEAPPDDGDLIMVTGWFWHRAKAYRVEAGELKARNKRLVSRNKQLVAESKGESVASTSTSGNRKCRVTVNPIFALSYRQGTLGLPDRVYVKRMVGTLESGEYDILFQGPGLPEWCETQEGAAVPKGQLRVTERRISGLGIDSFLGATAISLGFTIEVVKP